MIYNPDGITILALAQQLADLKRAVGDLLKENGCDCPCDHTSEEHEEDCERCLACRISAVLGPEG